MLNAAKIIWAIAPFAPTKVLTVGAITQSVDAGLAPAAVAWGAAIRDQIGYIVTNTSPLLLKLASAANACSVYGYALTNSAGTQVLLSELFPAPLPLVDTLTAYNIVVPFAPANPTAESVEVF